MALNGLAPIIIFTFYKPIPASLAGLFPASITRIPLVPIPVYLDEKITGIQLDDYDRTITIDVMRDGVTAFERVSGDVVHLKFHAKKDSILLTILTALIDRVMKTFDEAAEKTFDDRNYSLTIFYDNIFILDASLEEFSTRLKDGTDLREFSFTFSKRSEKKLSISNAISNTAGTALGT
jgi:hypothetical protein